jgi:hypothetical protein
VVAAKALHLFLAHHPNGNGRADRRGNLVKRPMIGAAAFVRASHGLYAQDGGWELVGVIAACELALMAAGASRFSVDHLVRVLRERQLRAVPSIATPSPTLTPP